MTTLNASISFHTLPNGLRVVHEAMPWLSSVSFTFLIPFGAVHDPEGLEGSATVLNDWLYRGAGKLNSRELSDSFDALGVRRGGGSGKEYTSFSASLLADSFEDALKLYRLILLEPQFNEPEFASAKMLAEQELASLSDSPTQQLFETLSKRYFVSTHGNSSYGTQEGLQALQPASLTDYFKQHVGPRDSILSVAGGVSWEQVLDQTTELFSDWAANTTPLPRIELAEQLQDHIHEDSAQTQIGLAFDSVAPGHKGWYEQALSMSILSGGMGARLFTEVREKRGLVYSVAAVNRALKNYGYALAYAGTTPDRAIETLDVLKHELEHIANGVTEGELERARTGLLSQLIMQGESSGSRASALARDTFLLDQPRPIESVKQALSSIDLDQLNGFLAEKPKPEFSVLTLGPRALEPQLKEPA